MMKVKMMLTITGRQKAAGFVLAAILFAAWPAMAGQAAVTDRATITQGLLRPVTDERPVASVDLSVLFEFNSAGLTAQARRQLDQLGLALGGSELSGMRFGIYGHTDAVGLDAANMTLSKIRAAAVRDYLITRHGIEATRLLTDGFGEARLKDKANPNSAINRRVEIVNLSATRPIPAAPTAPVPSVSGAQPGPAATGGGERPVN